jgi:hypothetical protein
VKIDTVDAELRLLAREDQRLLALQTIYEIGPVLAATCSPRSATPAASAAPANSSAPPASTRSWSNQARHGVAEDSPSKAHHSCAGRSSRPPNTPPGDRQPAPTTPLPPGQTARRRPTGSTHHRPQDRPPRPPPLRQPRAGSLTPARRHSAGPPRSPPARTPTPLTTTAAGGNPRPPSI